MTSTLCARSPECAASSATFVCTWTNPASPASNTSSARSNFPERSPSGSWKNSSPMSRARPRNKPLEATLAPVVPANPANGGRGTNVPVHLLTSRVSGPVFEDPSSNVPAASSKNLFSASAVRAAVSDMLAEASGRGLSTGRSVKKNGSESVTSPIGGSEASPCRMRRIASPPSMGNTSKR